MPGEFGPDWRILLRSIGSESARAKLEHAALAWLSRRPLE
jgi:hypothetical protein